MMNKLQYWIELKLSYFTKKCKSLWNGLLPWPNVFAMKLTTRDEFINICTHSFYMSKCSVPQLLSLAICIANFCVNYWLGCEKLGPTSKLLSLKKIPIIADICTAKCWWNWPLRSLHGTNGYIERNLRWFNAFDRQNDLCVAK